MPKKDKAKVKEYNRKYYLKHREWFLEYSKKHYLKNKKRMLDYQRKRRLLAKQKASGPL